jgi:hypothetical protein
MLTQRSQDPYEEALVSQAGIHRKVSRFHRHIGDAQLKFCRFRVQGEGWGNARKSPNGLSLFGAKEEKSNKQADTHQGSRFKNFFRGILKR